MSEAGRPANVYDPATLTSRERYHLLTSLVVPRPIAWISTGGAGGAHNLAPFSYFMAVSHSPMLVAVSIGMRGDKPKDTLRNIRETGVFCINIVDVEHLEAMNTSAGEFAADRDEFELAGLSAVESEGGGAPYVDGAPAVLECRLVKEVDLPGAPNALVVAEVAAIRLAAGLDFESDSMRVLPDQLRPVARLGGDAYAGLGEIVRLGRPAV